MNPKRLFSGEMTSFKPSEYLGDKQYIERDALLVYEGIFQSMDGKVTVTPESLGKLAAAHNYRVSKFSSYDECPPVQVDHSNSAHDTVGRLVGSVEVRDAIVNGRKVKALFGKVRILGKENVVKVMDGRWKHLSIQSDFESEIAELTITPFPAAAGSKMLSRLSAKTISESPMIEFRDVQVTSSPDGSPITRRQVFVDNTPMLDVSNANESEVEGILRAALTQMSEKKDGARAIDQVVRELGEKVKRLARLSQGENGMDKEKLKKHLMETEKCSAEDAEKRLSEMNDEDMKSLSKKMEDDEAEKKKLASEEEEERKRLAAEEAEKEEQKKLSASKEVETKRLAALAETKSKFVKLAKGAKDTAENARLMAREERIATGLKRLRASGKITPAEEKKIDLKRLASENEATVSAVLKTYEDREPVVDPRQLGTTSALNLASIAKDVRMSQREHEARLSMPTKRKALEKEAKAKGVTVEKLSAQSTMAPIPAAPETEDLKSAWKEIRAMIDERKEDAAYAAFRLCAQARGTEIHDDKRTEALAEKVNEMQTMIHDLVRLAGPAIGITEADLQ